MIFSGGSGSINRSDLGHSQVAKLFYKNIGVDINKIFLKINQEILMKILFIQKILQNQKKMKLGY